MGRMIGVRIFPATIVVLSLTVFSRPLMPDTVILDDGNRIENVRVIYQSGRVNLIRADGGIQSYAESAVRAVQRAPVQWRLEMSEVEFSRRMAVRVSEVIARIQAEEELRRTRHRDAVLSAAAREAILPGWSRWKHGQRAGLLKKSENFRRRCDLLRRSNAKRPCGPVCESFRTTVPPFVCFSTDSGGRGRGRRGCGAGCWILRGRSRSFYSGATGLRRSDDSPECVCIILKFKHVHRRVYSAELRFVPATSISPERFRRAV